jgi:Domain of unknown function (DUF222)/HNH endonuclease
VSGLRSALEELQAEDLWAVESSQLEADLVELERAGRILQAERLRRIAEVDRRNEYHRDGHLSISGWLASRLRIGVQAATAEVRSARALGEMPSTRSALAAGEVSGQAVRLLVRAKEAHPGDFSRDEDVLLDAAKRLRVRDLYRAIEHWRQAADMAGSAEEEELRFQRRYLHVSSTLHGSVRVDGDLDPETGQSVITALNAVGDADVRGFGDRPDLRSARQRRADALGELCRQWLDSSGRPTVAGERPHMSVIVDVESLVGAAGKRSEFEAGQPLHPEAARRIACDAAITRVLTSGRSEPLDVGRRTAVVSPVTRRALVVRDRHCTFPGCARPSEWCDAHHVRHWADGGPTALSNLILLCRPHHRVLHQRDGFRVEMEDGRPKFFRSDGTRLDERAPP